MLMERAVIVDFWCQREHLTQLKVVREPLTNIHERNITKGGVQIPVHKIHYTSEKGGGWGGIFAKRA